MNADEKVCPRCAETIKSAAVVCRFCGHEFASPPAEPAIADAAPAAAAEEPQPDEYSGKQVGKIIGFGCLGFIVIAVIASLAGTGTTQSNSAAPASSIDMNATANLSVADANLIANADEALNEAAAETSGGWSYSSSHDEVRGKTVYYASVDSDNEVEFDFPYSGGSTLTMTVRKHPQYGQDVIFRISKGQFVCGVESCSGTINFGKGPERISLTEPSDYDSQSLFASNGPSVINKLRAAGKVTVELPFYQEGNQQFTFKTRGLIWPPKS